MDFRITHSLHDLISDTKLILPEIILAILVIVILITGVVTRGKSKSILLSLIIFCGLIFSAIMLYFRLTDIMELPERISFSGFLHIDSLAIIFQFLFMAGGFLFTILSLAARDTVGKDSETEYYVIFLGILLGSMFMAMASNLLMVYISIELVSISSYMLASFGFNRKSIESGMKYILFGAVSSAVMLYGISLLYGYTHSLDFLTSGFIDKLAALPALPVLTALMMVMAGLLFKMAVVPFHIWTPDIYEGAPVPLIAFFSVVPKLGGLVIFARFFYTLNQQPMGIDWQMIFGMLAILTMFIGNLAALWQKEAKRMMGYSSIAHAGYLLTGIVALNAFGLLAVIVHATVYLLMNFLVFLLIELYYPVTGSTVIENYAGQFRKSPAYAALILIGFISLIGIPPTGGFSSKLLLFSSAWDGYSHQGSSILLWLVIAGVLNTLISVFYYLRIPYFMAFREHGEGRHLSVLHRPFYLGVGIILVLFIFIIFIRPDLLLHILNKLNFVYRGMTQ